MIILDNASIHRTPQARSIAKSYNMNIIGLPPYCPHLALVEFVFGMIKDHIKHLLTDEIIDYEKESGKKAIITGLKRLSPVKVVNMWMKIVKEAKLSIILTYTEQMNLPKSIWIDQSIWRNLNYLKRTTMNAKINLHMQAISR